MKWQIPAKTFLLGEYAAIFGESALVLTTSPCFELNLVENEGLAGIHPESPAGQFWHHLGLKSVGLTWHDPYQGRGGLGASSAQFLGVYAASKYLKKESLGSPQALLETYLHFAWQGIGTSPSGYDVLAQSMCACVYINQRQGFYQSYAWPFNNLAFILVHTGQKLATHHHLQSVVLPEQTHQLSATVALAKQAFELVDEARLINAVNKYHEQLVQLNLVADHSMTCLARLRKQPNILAAKGCGALGADILLLLVAKNKLAFMQAKLLAEQWNILATSADLYEQRPLVEKYSY